MPVMTRMDTAEARHPTKEKAATARKLGEGHLKRLAPELHALRLGANAYVVVNVTNGAYDTGESQTVALTKYRAAHAGQMGWACRIEDVQ